MHTAAAATTTTINAVQHCVTQSRSLSQRMV